ncbi:MAG: 3-isopropylmalate dehydrogenase [Actinobacteria bacterium]|nr:3-isopropylmalate dehydrogenase [Actinomycetota bacterium]
MPSRPRRLYALVSDGEVATDARDGARIDRGGRPVKVTVLGGDGVGPEVVAEALRVLRVASEASAIPLVVEGFPWGTGWYLEHGEMMPSDALARLAGFDAILLGAVGSPLVPDHITLREMLLRIRFGFDQYVNLRPVRLLPGVSSPLARADDLDILFVRENSEGEYSGVGDRLFPGTPREVALQTSVFSRLGVERVIRWAFQHARDTGRARVTSVSKANALNYSAVLWDEVFEEVAADFAGIESESVLVDAAAMYLVTRPERFDVVVASNLFADILTEIGAALQGGLGLAASANLNPERRFPSMFEPVHGSAPDIAGKGIANPIGAIWSVSLLLGHCGHPRESAAVMRAVEEILEEGNLATPDLGGASTTREVGEAIAARTVEILRQS